MNKYYIHSALKKDSAIEKGCGPLATQETISEPGDSTASKIPFPEMCDSGSAVPGCVAVSPGLVVLWKFELARQCGWNLALSWPWTVISLERAGAEGLLPSPCLLMHITAGCECSQAPSAHWLWISEPCKSFAWYPRTCQQDRCPGRRMMSRILEGKHSGICQHAEKFCLGEDSPDLESYCFSV